MPNAIFESPTSRSDELGSTLSLDRIQRDLREVYTTLDALRDACKSALSSAITPPRAQTKDGAHFYLFESHGFEFIFHELSPGYGFAPHCHTMTIRVGEEFFCPRLAHQKLRSLQEHGGEALKSAMTAFALHDMSSLMALREAAELSASLPADQPSARHPKL